MASPVCKSADVPSISGTAPGPEVGSTSSSPGPSAAAREEAAFPSDPDEPNYAPVFIGATLADGKYEIVRKLGYGVGSTVWLAKTQMSDQSQKYVAIKVLTRRHSNAIKRGTSSEDRILSLLKNLAENSLSKDKPCTYPGLENIIAPIDIFEEQGTHYCFVMRPCAENVRLLRAGLTLQQFPLAAIKSVVHQTLSALLLVYIGFKSGHLDVKWDNVYVDLPGNPDSAIEKFLQENPPETYPLLPGQDLATTVSQPLPISAFGVPVQDIHVRLGDFGSAMKAAGAPWPVDKIATPALLRPPELLLDGFCSTPADVWAVGCMVYELLIPNSPLFFVEPTPEQDGYRVDDIIRCIGARLLGPRTDDPGSTETAVDDADLETLVRSNPDVRANLTEQEIVAICAFMRKCLTLDPDRRPTVPQLLKDEWFAT